MDVDLTSDPIGPVAPMLVAGRGTSRLVEPELRIVRLEQLPCRLEPAGAVETIVFNEHPRPSL